MNGSTLLAEQAKRTLGNFTSVGKLDGTPRFYSFRTLQRYPLIVAVATSKAATLAPVRERARNYRIFAALACVCAILFMGSALFGISRQRRAAATLADTEVRFRGLAESMPQLVWICRPDGWSIYFNRRWVEYTGLSLDESYGYGWAKPIHPDDKQRTWTAWKHALETGDAYEVACRLLGSNGGYQWVLARGVPIRDTVGTIVSWFGTCTDIDEQKRTEAALQESERFANATIDALSKSIAVIDASGRILLVNKAWREFARANGAAPALVSEGSNYLDVCDKAAAEGDGEAAAVSKLLRAVIAAERTIATFEYACHGPSEQRWFCLTLTRFSDDGPVRIVVSHENTTQRKLHERHIEYLATHDALTDLPNRNLLNDRMEQAINHAGRVELQLAVILVDLDHFKYVNDGFGRPVGDELLAMVARELEALVRSGDTVARLGGDEFVLLLADLKDAALSASTISGKLLERFSRPFAIGEREFTVSASIGISLYPGDGQDPDTLLMNADGAMYHAKEAGRNSFQFSAPEMKNKAIQRVALEGALHRALRLEQFELHYQPLVVIATGEAIGTEALIRWRHPELGLIAPAQFITLAEETGLIIPIGEWVLRTACAQNKAWQDAGLPPLIVSVNLSAIQLRQAGLVDLVAGVLAETGLAGCYLNLELTETMVMGKSQSAVDCLHRLKTLGISLSIDDFGTGYSNLGYLNSFPLDQLKIDRSFVNDLPDSSNAASIARAIVSMAHSLGLRVVAEGVETAAQAQFLSSIRCEHAQGYLYSKPLPPAEFAKWLADYQFTGTKSASLDNRRVTSREEGRCRASPADD
jgi:diguanylate cyclase (GGDEF)-like protein/PAS domain S-box-containing protein